MVFDFLFGQPLRVLTSVRTPDKTKTIALYGAYRPYLCSQRDVIVSCTHTAEHLCVFKQLENNQYIQSQITIHRRTNANSRPGSNIDRTVTHSYSTFPRVRRRANMHTHIFACVGQNWRTMCCVLCAVIPFALYSTFQLHMLPDSELNTRLPLGPRGRLH